MKPLTLFELESSSEGPLRRIEVRSAVVIAFAMLLVPGGSPALAYTDGDSDRVSDEHDNCQGLANPLQFDVDEDGEGDMCEGQIIVSDAFRGTPASDLVFGSFRVSMLAGGDGPDALYGGPDDDVLDGGPGTDLLAGGPGDDVLTGGRGCDVFGIHTAIGHRDVITDFAPVVDRLRFSPRAAELALNRLPSIEVGGSEHLEIAFKIEGAPDAVVVFEGIRPGTRLLLSTKDCGDSPPPPSVCPRSRARRNIVFVGLDDMFCPDSGELWLNTGIYETVRFGSGARKSLGVKTVSGD